MPCDEMLSEKLMNFEQIAESMQTCRLHSKVLRCPLRREVLETRAKTRFNESFRTKALFLNKRL